VPICLERKALNWFQWWEVWTERIAWFMFKRALMGVWMIPKHFIGEPTSGSYKPLSDLRSNHQRIIKRYRPQRVEGRNQLLEIGKMGLLCEEGWSRQQ